MPASRASCCLWLRRDPAETKTATRTTLPLSSLREHCLFRAVAFLFQISSTDSSGSISFLRPGETLACGRLTTQKTIVQTLFPE